MYWGSRLQASLHARPPQKNQTPSRQRMPKRRRSEQNTEKIACPNKKSFEQDNNSSSCQARAKDCLQEIVTLSLHHLLLWEHCKLQENSLRYTQVQVDGAQSSTKLPFFFACDRHFLVKIWKPKRPLLGLCWALTAIQWLLFWNGTFRGGLRQTCWKPAELDEVLRHNNNGGEGMNIWRDIFFLQCPFLACLQPNVKTNILDQKKRPFLPELIYIWYFFHTCDHWLPLLMWNKPQSHLQDKEKFKAVSLFSGIGGLELGIGAPRSQSAHWFKEYLFFKVKRIHVDIAGYCHCQVFSDLYRWWNCSSSRNGPKHLVSPAGACNTRSWSDGKLANCSNGRNQSNPVARWNCFTCQIIMMLHGPWDIVR